MADPARLDGDQKVDSTKLPIVFVPGLMGTKLKFGKHNFNPDQPMTMLRDWIEEKSAFDRRKYLRRSPVKILDRDKGHFSGQHSVVYDYWPFFKYLEKHEFLSKWCPLFVFGYNWKQSNPVSGGKLAKAINKLTRKPPKKKRRQGYKQVILVTHSMGGHVVRHALKDDSGLATKVKAVIHVAHPAAGTPKFLRMLFSGAKVAWGEERREHAMFFGESGFEFAILATQIPSAMELLPTRYYSDSGKPWSFIRFAHESFEPDAESLESMASRFGDKSGDLAIPDPHKAYALDFAEGGLYNPGLHYIDSA